MTAPFASAAGVGELLWTLGELVTIRLAGEHCDDRLALVEHLAPGGLATPLHAQPLADETFYVLEGEVSVMLDGHEEQAGPGAVVCVPRGTPHALRVTSECAHLISVHNRAGQERFFRAAGRPAPSANLPPGDDGPPDLDHVMAAAAAHDVEILGPPPWA